MPRSKKIADYFEASFDVIKSDQELTFDVHLYFEKNAHILTFFAKGTQPEEAQLARYRNRNLKKFWVHLEDRPAFDAYLNPALVPVAAATPAPEALVAPVENEVPPPAEVAAEAPNETPKKIDPVAEKIADALTNPEIPEEKKVEMVSQEAQKQFADLMTAQSVEEQKKKDQVMKKMVQDLLEKAADQMENVVSEIWEMDSEDDIMEHGVTTATYAVVLAMAFGKIDANLIADIAYAALVHDIGVTQIPMESIPAIHKGLVLKKDDPYRSHVNESVQIIKELKPDTRPRVFTIIQQHHEKFDGSGFPGGIKGFKVDDIAQIVALANMLALFSSGEWDGKPRTLREAFEEIESLEKVRTFPEFFNPEVLSAIMKWIKKEMGSGTMEKAAEIVEKQARSLAS